MLILNATICDAQSAFNGKKCDVFINQGVIEDISLSSKKQRTSGNVKTWDLTGHFMSPGWFDMRASMREPGLEHKETLVSAAHAAASGGFTTVACLPDTEPALQSKADIEFIFRKAESLPINILPYGAITKNRMGKDLNELYDMHQAGAIGFTDGNRTISDAGIMMRAMQYAADFNGLLLSHALDQSLSGGASVHEGITSTNLGLKGIPNIAEELMIARDIELVRYTGNALHFSHLSSKGSVELIRKAKKQGLPVTADVAVANLVYTEDALHSFDTNYKQSPPLRSATDLKALWQGIADGTIDCIVSDHQPEDTEHKELEFEYAANGMIQLQTAFSLLCMHKPQTVSLDTIVQALTVNPRRILRQPPVSLSVGSKAELTVFNPTTTWVYNEKTNHSKSKNSPVYGQTLTGKAIAIINKDQLIKNV